MAPSLKIHKPGPPQNLRRPRGLCAAPRRQKKS